MFTTLRKNATKTAELPDEKGKKKKKAGIGTVKAALKGATAMARIQLDLAHALQAASDFRDLRRLKRIGATEGFSKDLMMFANPGNVNSAFIKGLPSVESLDLTPLSPADRRSQLALKGLKAALEDEGEVVQSWLEATAGNLDALFDAVREQTDGFIATADVLREHLEGAAVAEATLADVTVTTIAVGARQAQVEKLAELVALIEAPDFDAEDEGHLAAAKSAIQEIVSGVAAFTGASYDGLAVVAEPEKIAEEYQATEGTLADKGYTAEASVELLQKLAALVGALQALADKQPAIVERLKALAQDAVVDAREDEEPVGGQEDLDPETPAAPENPDELPPAAPFDEGNGEEEPAPAPVEPEPENPEVVPATEDEDAAPSALENSRTIMSGWISVLMLLVEASLSAIADGLAVTNEVSECAGGPDLDDDESGKAPEDEDALL